MLRATLLSIAVAAALAVPCSAADHPDLHPYRLKIGAVGPVDWEVVVEEVGKTEVVVRVESELRAEYWAAPWGRLEHQISVLLRGYDCKDLADGKPFQLHGTYRVAGTRKLWGRTMFVLEPPGMNKTAAEDLMGDGAKPFPTSVPPEGRKRYAGPRGRIAAG